MSGCLGHVTKPELTFKVYFFSFSRKKLPGPVAWVPNPGLASGLSLENSRHPPA